MSPSTTCFTPLMKQTWLSSSVLMSTMAQGLVMGYMSCLLPALQLPDSLIKTDIHSASWLASAYGCSQIIGVVMSCIFINVFGRRRAYLLFILPGAIGWLMIYLAQSYIELLIARILNGITASSMSTIGAVVIAEYTDPKHRGMFLNLKTAAICLGNTLVHILGKFLSWRTIAILSVIPHILAACIAYTWPESPAWLASKGEFTRCAEAFLWLRGSDENSACEIKELIRSQKEKLRKSKNNDNFKNKLVEFLEKFKKKDFLKPIFIACTAFVLLEASTRHLFPTYALQIIGEITSTKSLPFYYTLGIDLMITVSATSSSIFIRYLRRRTLLFLSGISAIIVITFACIYLILVSHGILSNERPWIPLSLFSIFFVLANLGCTPIPLVIQGEIFPLPHRAVATAIAGTMKSLFIVAFLKVTPYLLVNMKVHGAFIVFACIMAISLLILYFILPETKDRTLQEIEDYFNYGQFIDKNAESDDQVRQKMINNE